MPPKKKVTQAAATRASKRRLTITQPSEETFIAVEEEESITIAKVTRTPAAKKRKIDSAEAITSASSSLGKKLAFVSVQLPTIIPQNEEESSNPTSSACSDKDEDQEVDTPATSISTSSGGNNSKLLKKATAKVLATSSTTATNRRRSTRLTITEKTVIDDTEADEDSDEAEEEEDFMPSDAEEDEDFVDDFQDVKGKSVAKSMPTRVRPRTSSGPAARSAAKTADDIDEIDDDGDDAESILSELDSATFDDDEESEDEDIDLAPPTRIPSRHAPRSRGRQAVKVPRAVRERMALHEHHPQLATVWQDLDEREKIPTVKDPQPEGLTLTMLPFQLEGLHWLRTQEQTKFNGGILADEMGMGKTIQTIALLMAEPRQKPNLVVAPTVALMQWKNEIEKHTANALTVVMFHGQNRDTDQKSLEAYDVVMTTYSVLESSFRKQQTGHKRKDGIVKAQSVLHQIQYHRVILDEAHNIKDRSCNTSRAVFALKTKHKLCLTGTPLQNRIGEFFSLLRFLEVDPFSYYFCRKCPCKSLHWKFSDMRHCDQCKHRPMDHCCWFNSELLKPIQLNGNEGEGKLAFEKLHKLLSHIMLRRTKMERADDLGLPPRIVRIRRDYFNEEELDLYDSIYGESKRKFNTYVAQGVVLNNYANIFTLITRMRQLADHPDLVLRRQAQEGQNTLVCCICDDEAEDAIQSKCHHKFCRVCVTKYIDGYTGSNAPDCPHCHISLSIDLSQPAIEDFSEVKRGSILNRIDMSNWRSSTKIEALVEELYKLRSKTNTIKSIVFSQFTSMLHLIEWRLHRGGFKTVMLEGSMSPTQRDAVIKHFMENTEVEVFLVSLKAGGVALNLTEASQVFIMDPWWNPSVEWQSGDRVHRIGQKRACRITRLVIEDSIESRIVELQEKKARMIHATVGGDQKSMEKLTPADMQFLFTN